MNTDEHGYGNGERDVTATTEAGNGFLGFMTSDQSVMNP
jgi:hypothetical protein